MLGKAIPGAQVMDLPFCHQWIFTLAFQSGFLKLFVLDFLHVELVRHAGEPSEQPT